MLLSPSDHEQTATRFFSGLALLSAANAAQAGFSTTSPNTPAIGPSDVAQPLFSESGYFGLSRVGDVYAGGAAFNATGVRNFSGTTADFAVGGDRTFFASLSPDVAAVPVPPTIALALVRA